MDEQVKKLLNDLNEAYGDFKNVNEAKMRDLEAKLDPEWREPTGAHASTCCARFTRSTVTLRRCKARSPCYRASACRAVDPD